MHRLIVEQLTGRGQVPVRNPPVSPYSLYATFPQFTGHITFLEYL
jgi:hypothetical protein